jgi:hypothetical protein
VDEGLSTVQEKFLAVLWAFMMRCGCSAVESGFGAASKGERKEKKRTT